MNRTRVLVADSLTIFRAGVRNLLLRESDLEVVEAPHFAAVKNIVADPARYNLSLADVPDARFIEEWRFTNRGATVVIRAHGYHGPALYLKYAVPSGKLVDHVGTYRPFAELPAWAKSIADESSKE